MVCLCFCHISLSLLIKACVPFFSLLPVQVKVFGYLCVVCARDKHFADAVLGGTVGTEMFAERLFEKIVDHLRPTAAAPSAAAGGGEVP